jgi:hypothetical protein
MITDTYTATGFILPFFSFGWNCSSHSFCVAPTGMGELVVVLQKSGKIVAAREMRESLSPAPEL